MFLRAIGVYIEEVPNSGKLKKVQSAQEGDVPKFSNLPSLNTNSLFSPKKPDPEVAPPNDLENIDKILLNPDRFKTITLPYEEKSAVGEFNYIFKPPGQNYILAMSCKRPMDEKKPIEKIYLFENIGHIYRNPGIKDLDYSTDGNEEKFLTLSSVIANPLRFIGRDILIGNIKDNIKLTLEKMWENVEMAIQRGERLENLEAKADSLCDNSVSFKNHGKKLNSYCCYY